MPSLLDFVFNKRKPIPGEWEYDMHPGPDTQNDFSYQNDPVYDAPLYQGEQWGLMDDWIPDEPSPTMPSPTMPSPTSPTPATPPPTGYGVDPGAFFPIDDPSWSTEISTPVRAYDSSMSMGGTRGISQHMADWILNRYPEQEMSDRYQISGWDVNPDDGSYTPLYNNPILSYSPEHNSAYLNSPEYKSYTESISGFPSGMSPGDLATWDV